MRCTLWLLSWLFTAQASYQGVSNVHLEDDNDIFGMVTGTISWTLPDNMTNVVSFKPYFAVDYDSPSGNDDYTHQYGMAAGAQSNTIQEVAAPATEFHVGVTAPGYAFQRRPPWPWKGTPAEPFIYSGDAPLLVVKVLAKIGSDYQTNDQLLPQSMHVVNDVGWTGDPPLDLSFIMEEGGSSSGGVEVTFVDSDTRCGYVGGAINISVPFGVDVTMLRWARLDFAEDLQGTNALTIAWVDIALSGSVPIPADLQHGSRVYLLLVGSVNDTWEVPYGAIFQDDCGGVPNVAFNMSFIDEDPLSGVISGTVRLEIARDAADEYSSMNFYLATRASTQPTWLGSIAPLQTEFVLTGIQLNSRDLLLAYLNNSYGQQVDPVVVQIQEMITAVPSSESQVLSIQFNDEDGLFGKIAGLVTWSPGSMAVTEYFAVFAAQNASGKGQVQVSPNVSADAAHEWYINASLDTSGEPYTYLLVYPGNSIGFAASALSVHFEDSRVTCRNDAFEPCPKSQVLKDEELLPYACQGERCSAQECCTDAGTCSDFLNGTSPNASNGTGCADGYVAMQSPPEFCAGAQCQNYDCCLRTAEAMATVQTAATTWDSIQVTWSVPSLNNCTFQEYQVQLLAENSSNSTWQDVTSCELKDSCGSSCLATGLRPSSSSFRARVRVKCLLIGAHDQEFFSAWTESALSATTGQQPPNAPALIAASVRYETEVLQSWNPLDANDLGPDCTFESWSVQIRELGTSVWISVTTCGATAQCLIQNLKCNTDYEVRVAAICQGQTLMGEYSYSSFSTTTGEKCLRPAQSPSNVAVTVVGTSNVTVMWTPGDAMECIFDSWLVQFRVTDAATWQSQGCSSLRSDALCTVEGLGSATSYEIRIQETCNVSSTNSEWSNVTFATTLGLPADVSGVAVEVLSYDSVQLSWSLPSLNDCIFSQYHLQRAVAGTSAWQDVICQASSVCDTSCRVSALPSNTAWTFHVRTLCGNDQVLNSDWSDASLPMSTWPRPAVEVELRSATVLSHDVVVLTWLRPTTNDCILQGYQVELYDGAWRADPSGCATVSQSATGCTLTNLACDTEFQARVIARCSDPLANSGTGNATVFRTTAGAECLKSATLPRGLLLISGSVGQLTFTWEAGEANDCTFNSWDVRLNTSDGQSAASCHNSARNLTSCTFSNLAENTTYLASVQEICSQSLLSSLIAGSLPATTLSVPVPSVVLQLPFPNEPVSSRPTELTVMYDVDVEFPVGGPLPQVCAQAPCSGCTPQEAPSVRNFRLLSWAQNSSFWRQGCSYDVSLPLGFVVTRQQPGKSSPISHWSFTFRVPDPQILHLAQVLQVSTESATVSIAWDSSVEFRCRVASLETVWQLAPREVSSFVDFTGLLPETRYDIECMARLQDEPSVVSSWLSAGQLQTEKDFNVELEELYLHVQPLCLSHSMESYELPVTPTLQSNRTNYSVALPNADFALNCTQQEATWQLELRTKAQSQYARTEVTTDNGTTDVLMLTLPAEEVLVTSSFSVTVTAGCGCAVESYHVEVMGLRLSFHVGLPSVTKATGDAVPLNQTEEGHRLQVSVSYDNDALPSSLWNSLSIYLGPFQQVTLAAPAELQTPASQVYTLMTTLSAVGKDLPLQLRLAGALVGQSSSNVSFAAPFVNCISTVGYGQCTAEELEKKEVFVRTLGETMLYVKGQGFGNHEALPGSDLMRISVTQSFNITELCEASGFVSNTEMWCRLVPKGASPLEMWLLGPMESAELLQVPWSIRYEAPLIENFSQPVLKIMDGGQLYIIGQNFPDFQDDGGTVGFEANGSRRLRALEGISTSEVCTSLTRVNQTHLLCDMKSRIDLTRARCTDVDIVVAWGDLTTEMGTVPLRLTSPQITGVLDATPNRKGRAVEVGSFFYRLDGVGFGTTENGRIQVLVGNRSCEVSSRNDTQIFCQMTGPLRDDLSSLYPETPENASDGDVDVSVVMPVWISLGSSSIESSEDCKAIAANWSSHEVYLKNCVAGSQRESTRTDECIQCQPGWFTPVAGPFLQCLGCPKASFSYSPGSTACEACPSGRTTYQNATPSALDCSCLPGRFVPLTERVAELEILERIRQGEAAHSANHQLSSCVSCPVGASCAGGLAPPVAEPGWWLLANEVPVQCMMEGCLGNNTCRRGYNPRTRCETCMDQFYPDLEESTCNECESWVLLFGMIYSAVTFVVLFGFFFPFLSWKARVALDPAKGVAPPKLCFGLFHCCLKRYVARRQLVSAEYVDMSLYHDKVWKYTRRALQHFQCVYHSPMRRICQGADLQPVVNIIFNNLQVFFLLANIGYHSWPERFKEALNFGLLLVSSAESLRPSCVAPIGSEGRWYLIFAAPLALYLSCVLFVYFRQRDKKRCLRIILMVSGAFMLYLSPFCLLTASMVFDCVRSGANEWVWDLDRGIVCWSDPEWFRMAAVGIGGLVLLFIVLIFIAVSAYRTYHWYRTAEVGMMSPKAVFFTWWWLSGLRGLSLKHRAAIQGYKVHLDLPKDVTEASEVSSLCDDLLLQNVANLKSGIARLNDYLQGFRVDDARDSASRPWHLRGQEAFCEHCQGCGKHMHNHKHKAVHVSGWYCGLCQSSAETSGVIKMRTRLRKAAYNRLTMRLEHLLLELRQMSSFSDRSRSLKDLLSFAWELITLVYKTSLGMTRLLSTQHHTLGLQVSLWLSIGYLVLVLTVWPYRHNGLNILSGFFAGLNAHIVYSLIQMEKDSDSFFWNVTAAAVTLTILVTMVLVPLFWAFFALWGAAFSENYYVMATQEVQGTLWRGPSSPKSQKNAEIEDGNDGNAPKEETGAPEGKKAYASMLTRVVSSPEELLPDEPVAAQWCFRLPLDTCARGGPSKDPSAVQHMELTLEQGIGITVRSPAMLLQILNAEGGDVDFHGKWGLPALPPCRLRRGGDLPGRLRISVPCSDQRSLRTTLKQLNALSDATHRERHASQSSPKHERDTFSVDDVTTPRSHEPSVYSTLSLFSTLEDRHESEMAPRLSTVTTNTQATQATQASVVSQKPNGAAFQMKALTKAVKIGGRIVPQGAHMDSIRYVPPGTSVEDAMVESPEEFLYRLSRSRFGKGGVLRDAHGVLVLEFQRPDDPLDVQMELAELILSRDEVPEEKPEGGVDAPPSGLRTRQKVEWARAMYTERAKALVWDVGEFVLPLDLRFTWPVPSLQLQVSPKPDWGCMQQVLVLSRGGQQWILQAQEVNYHLGLAGEVSVKRRRQALRNSSGQPNAEAQESFEMIDESDEDLDLEDEDTESLQAMTTVRTGKSSGSRGHFGSRSAWRTKSGGVVFVHDFSCFGGTLELVGRPQDIKAVEKGELLGQQVLWHPPKRTPRPSAMQRLPGTEEKGDGTCSTMSAECPEDQPMRGWFDGQNLYWEPIPKLAGAPSDPLELQSMQEALGGPKEGELPAGPWVRISSALEPGGIPGPDSGLWTLQSSFYAACYGPVPLEFLEKLGDFQAGPGARELYLRTRRDARKGKEEERERPPPEEEEVIISDESSDEDYTLEALGLVETKQKSTVAFEEIIPTLKRNSQPPRLRTLDS